MSSFFHLSRIPNAKAIVPSSDYRTKQRDVFFSPRPPRDHASENSDPRICIGPTVWQCLVSGPEPETPLFIYSLSCSGAIRASREEHNVEDAETTDEHWIIDDVVRENDGYIPLLCEGVLRDTKEPRFLLWDWLSEQRRASVDPRSFNEREHLWIVDEATSPPEWRIRLRPSQEPADESPLLPPRTCP